MLRECAYSEIWHRSSMTNEGQVKYTPECSCSSSFIDRKMLTHDAVTMSDKKERHERSCLKEDSSYIHTKGHP